MPRSVYKTLAIAMRKWREYVCVNCGERVLVRKAHDELSRAEDLSKPRRCGRCRSYDVYHKEYIEELIRLTEERMEKLVLGVVPLLDAVETVIKEKGIRLTPISTIRLIRWVYQDVMKRTSSRSL